MHSSQLGPDSSFGLGAHALGTVLILVALLYPAYSWARAAVVRVRLSRSADALHARVKPYRALLEAVAVIPEPSDVRRLVYDVTHRPGRFRGSVTASVVIGTALGAGVALAITAGRLRWSGEGYVVGVLVLPWVGAVIGEMLAISECIVRRRMTLEPLPRAAAAVAALLPGGDQSGYGLKRHRAELCNRVEQAFVPAGIPMHGLEERRLTAVDSDEQWLEFQRSAARRLAQVPRRFRERWAGGRA